MKPSPWPMTTVGEQFDVQLGKMLDAARNTGEPKPYLGNRAVQWGQIDLDAVSEVPLTKADQVRYRLRDGDLLVCEGGEVGRAALWKGELAECYYQKALHRLRPRGDYNPRLMQALFEYLAATNGFTNYVTQTSIAHLPRERLLTLPIPLVPRAEQDRIVSVLDDCDDLIGGIERLIVKKDGVKIGLMQELLTAKSRVPGFSSEWKRRSMGSLGDLYGGLTGKTKDDFGTGDARYVPFMAVMSDVRVTGEALPAVRVAKGERQREVLDGDVLFNTSSETPEELAMASVACGLGPGTYLNSFCFGLRLSPGAAVDPMFLAYAFRSGVGRAKLSALAQGATRYNLSRAQFRRIELMLPVFDEQQAIVNVLGDADGELDSLRRWLAKARDVKQGVMQKLLSGRTRLPSAVAGALAA
jgi:type I restriction enzyme, S subunit